MFEDLQWADELSLEVIAELAKLARSEAAARRRDVPGRRGPCRRTVARVARPPAQPATGGGGSARAAHQGADRARHDAHPRHGPAGFARRRPGRLRPQQRHPAPHRGAARSARRGRADRCRCRPVRARPRHDRGRGPGSLRPPVREREGGRTRSRGHRSVLHPGGRRRVPGPPAPGARRAVGGARRAGVPVPVRLPRSGLLRLPSSAASRRAVRRRPALGAAPAPCASRRVRCG